MAKKTLTPERRSELQSQRDRLKRISEVTTELLSLFTVDDDLPPLPLPADMNGWTNLRYDVNRLVKAIDAQLATFEGE